MKLSAFIVANRNEILQEWDAFARTLFPASTGKSALALRDHASQILEELSVDIEIPQTAKQQADKSKGIEAATDDGNGDSAAAIHGTLRQYIGFTLGQVAAEYRALRATILRLWLTQITSVTPEVAYDMIRFNEAVDQALAESIETYAERTAQTRDTFLAILGHDLRSPLGAISIAGQYLKKITVGTAGTQAAGARIAMSATSMAAMVNDLLDYGRTRLGGEMPINCRRVNALDVCRAAVDGAAAAHPECVFDLNITSDAENLVGDFDPDRLQQVFANLLDNAYHHGSAEHHITLTASGESDSVVITVANFGSIIPANKLRAIFDPLVQLSPAVSGTVTGPLSGRSGLGLFIAREITIAHSGTIVAESSEQLGTVFTVTLPKHGAGLIALV